MKEVNEWTWRRDSENHYIVWRRDPALTQLILLPNTGGYHIIKQCDFPTPIIRRNMSASRFFTLTDDELNGMVLPRII